MLKIQGGDYIINLAHISDIEVVNEIDNEREWTVIMSSGHEFTLEEEDIQALTAALGLNL